ncbi:MAG TPA: TrkA family potassium uptake protein [Bacilli bacterium]|jgi:trk system potassium uptake protein TrkA|nr:TrkA family potassium uptake protein [Bacilli bacterium]HNY74620.1 TrkA family potassium uptake protein [Bacilli bacterium]HOH68342.1 TrkA family potassium uptake protein [Bacilli bacterium]HPV69963.1 TrkA family potassium uptake protein [Bacilli bacterium]HPY38647.1 TrkA family potassium uptake protein [Bacilli bacterium]
MRNKVLIIGCGRLGTNIAALASEKGQNVIVVDRNHNSFDRLPESFSGYRVTGDATDLSLLEEAYIKTAKEVVITTGDDNVNLFLAHVACLIYEVPSIYVRLDDPERGALLNGLKVKAIYPFELSINKFNLMKGEDL